MVMVKGAGKAAKGAGAMPGVKHAAVEGEKVKLTPEEQKRKLDSTIGWWNRHGGLKQQIEWEKVSAQLKRLSYSQARKILAQLADKGKELNNPTGWIITECQKVGGQFTSKEDSDKLKKSIFWWNVNHLQAAGKAIKYDQVVGPLSNIPIGQALKIMFEMGEKKDTIANPTNWICKYASRVLENSGGVPFGGKGDPSGGKSKGKGKAITSGKGKGKGAAAGLAGLDANKIAQVLSLLGSLGGSW